MVRSVLHEARHDVLARRCHGRIGQAGNDDVDVGPARVVPVFRFVVGALHVLDARRDRNGAAQVTAGAWKAAEVGQAVQGEVDLSRGAAKLVATNLVDEVAREIACVNELREGQPRVHGRRHDRTVDFVAVLEDHAGGAAVVDPDSADRRPGADFDAGLQSGCGNRVGDRAGPAFCETPRSERSVDLSHVMVEQHVRRAGRTDPLERADDARRRHRRFQHIGLEPLIQKIGGAHRHELNEPVACIGRERLEAASEAVQLTQVAWRERERIGRAHVERRLGEPRHVDHGLAVLVVGLGVEPGVAENLAARPAVVVGAPQVIAVGHRRERAVERKDLEAMTG